MQARSTILTPCFLTAWLLGASVAFGQFYNNGSQITIGNGGLLQTNMDLINADSSIYNAGNLVVNGNCQIANKSTSRILTSNGDTLFVAKDFYDGSLKGQNAGVLVLNGTAAQSIESTTHLLANLAVYSATDKTLQSNINVRFNLNLKAGHIIVPTGKLFGLDSTATITQTNTPTNSFVVGTLYRQRKVGTEDSLFFPIGNSKAEYRPATLLGIGTATGKYPVFSMTTGVGTPQAGTEVTTIYDRIWGVTSTIANHPVNKLKVYYQPTDVASTPAANLVLAQSATTSGTYHSIGAQPATSTYVVSEFKPTQTFYALGSSMVLKGNFKVILEGPFNGTKMTSALRTNNMLRDSLLLKVNMQTGYTPPSTAVDRISFTIVDALTKVKTDSVDAWLLEDGTIRDYATGMRSYVTFTKGTAGKNYYVIVSHRNHLPASSPSIGLTSATPLANQFANDYTNGVYGGGALYDVNANVWKLYASDAFKTWKNQTDIQDYVRTGRASNTVTNFPVYQLTDLNLDGKVTSIDVSIAADHNAKLYYSTLP